LALPALQKINEDDEEQKEEDILEQVQRQMSELDDIREASSLKAKHKTAMDASKNAKK